MAISELVDMTSRGMASLKRISTLLDAPLDMVDPIHKDGTVGHVVGPQNKVHHRSLARAGAAHQADVLWASGGSRSRAGRSSAFPLPGP